MNQDKNIHTDKIDQNTEVKVCSAEYFCEMCGFYPLIPVHGHYECPECRYKTKCCEGAPQ